jgi:hypothetical protein
MYLCVLSVYLSIRTFCLSVCACLTCTTYLSGFAGGLLCYAMLCRWFTAGSIGFMLTSALVLANNYDSDYLFGSDDSALTQTDYRASWWLMAFSGAFCIFGTRCVALRCVFL